MVIFYKGEDVIIHFKSVDDISEYTKVVKVFTPFSSPITATISEIDAFNFTATISDTQSAGLKTGTLNVVLEISLDGNTMISKTVECQLNDAYLNGGARESLSQNEFSLNFNDLNINVYFQPANYQSILDRIEALEYVPQTITSFTNNVNNVEKGSTVTSITFSFGFNKIPTTASINNGIGTVTGTSKTATVSLTTNTTYTLTASDGTTTVTANTSVNFLNKAYWGSSANATLNNSQVLGLVANTLTSTRNRTISVDGNGQYIYYCYPASFGDASFTIGGLGVTLIKNILTVTNALGDATLYNIYRTSDIQFGTAIQIQIT